MSESPFACVMSAIEPDKRAGHLANARELFQSVGEIRELENGYSFRFNDAPDLVTRIATFVQLEKLCCPFLGFLIEVEAESGPTWLSLTGREGVKPFIQAELSDFLGVFSPQRRGGR